VRYITYNPDNSRLHEISLKEACEAFQRRVEIYLADKRERVDSGRFEELDHFLCLCCVKYLNEVPKLQFNGQHNRVRRILHGPEDRDRVERR
jgi:hypothetical protein